MGESWICPVLPGSLPLPETPPSEIQTLPGTSSASTPMATLVLGKNALGEPVVSWLSLDDHSMKQKVLSGVTLDPVWDDFDSFYFNQHGNHVFAISPQVAEPTSGVTSPSFGPLDAAMLSALETDFDQMAVNVANGISAASYVPPPENPDAKGFYRIVADYGVDSNGGGRYDWQQILLDGTNPFAPGGGPGGSDLTPAGSGSGGGYPTPDDAQDPAPRAAIQQRTLHAAANYYIDGEDERQDVGSGIFANDPASGAVIAVDADLEEVSSMSGLLNVLQGTAFPDNLWDDKFSTFYMSQYIPPAEENLSTTFIAKRSQFRLKLDAPAPEGGYQIPMRLLKVHMIVNEDFEFEIVPTPGGGNPYEDITLTVAEGQTEGDPVDVPLHDDLGGNVFVHYIPANVTLTDPPIIPGAPGQIPADGVCVEPGAQVLVKFCENETNGDFRPEWMETIWQKRQLRGDGTFYAWSNQAAIPDAYGDGEIISIDDPGCHQIRALVTLDDGRKVEFPYLRMRHARSIRNSRNVDNPLLKAGQPDYLGVAENPLSLNVRNRAVEWLGSAKYRKAVNVPTQPGHQFNPDLGITPGRPDGSPKCNVFVTHIANQAGAATPYFYRIKYVFLKIPSAPIARDDWHDDPEKHIDLDPYGWSFRDEAWYPSPGMAISSPGAGGDAQGSGHVGIMDYDGSWINAGANTVNKSLHLLDESQDYKPNHFRAR